MSGRALDGLATEARKWARAYLSVTEALMLEGVPEERARAEARSAANFAVILPASLEGLEEGGARCPMCGGPAG